MESTNERAAALKRLPSVLARKQRPGSSCCDASGILAARAGAGKSGGSSAKASSRASPPKVSREAAAAAAAAAARVRAFRAQAAAASGHAAPAVRAAGALKQQRQAVPVPKRAEAAAKTPRAPLACRYATAAAGRGASKAAAPAPAPSPGLGSRVAAAMQHADAAESAARASVERAGEMLAQLRARPLSAAVKGETQHAPRRTAPAAAAARTTSGVSLQDRAEGLPLLPAGAEEDIFAASLAAAAAAAAKAALAAASAAALEPSDSLASRDGDASGHSGDSHAEALLLDGAAPASEDAANSSGAEGGGMSAADEAAFDNCVDRAEAAFQRLTGSPASWGNASSAVMAAAAAAAARLSLT